MSEQTSIQIIISEGMPFTQTEQGMHRSSVGELVTEIERLRAALTTKASPKWEVAFAQWFEPIINDHRPSANEAFLAGWNARGSSQEKGDGR